jgi:hypothetical protein
VVLDGGRGADEAGEHEHSADELTDVQGSGDAEAAEGAAEGRRQGSGGDKDVPNRAVEKDALAEEDPGGPDGAAHEGNGAVNIEQGGEQAYTRRHDSGAAQFAAGVHACGHQAGVKFRPEDADKSVNGTYQENPQRPDGPLLLRQQEDGALSQPSGDQDGAEEIPEAEDQGIPTEGAVVAFTKATNSVKGQTDPPKEEVGTFPFCVASEDKQGKHQANGRGYKRQVGIHKCHGTAPRYLKDNYTP